MLPHNLPRAGASRALLNPNAYFFDRFGSRGNRSPLVLADREMNQFKGRIFDVDVNPMAQDVFSSNLQDVLNNNFNSPQDEEDAVFALFNPIRLTISVFRYIHHPEVLPIIQRNRRNLLEATETISQHVVTLGNAHALHEEFSSLWYAARTTRARDWIQDRLVQIVQAFNEYEEDNDAEHPAQTRIFHEVKLLEDQIIYVQPPPADPEDEDDAGYPT